jgi:hypothetical protein
LEEAIAGFTDAIEALIGPFEVEVALLDTIPGVDGRIAECLVAEIGVDMSPLSDLGPPLLVGGDVPR